MYEDEIYANRKYWRRIKAFLAVFIVAGLIGLGGLSAVLYAFHLDPDVELTERTITHDGCPHTTCVRSSHQRMDVTYGSGEVAWSGIFFLAYLCGAGFCAFVVMGDQHGC